MRSRGPAAVWALLAFFVGLLPAFWFAGPLFFSVGISVARGFPRLLLYGLAILVLSAGGGALAPGKRLALVIGFAVPIVLVVALARQLDTTTALLAVPFIVAAFGLAWVGTWTGALLTDLALARRSKS